MNIAITGSSGFIGSALAGALVDNHHILSIDILDAPFPHPNLKHIRCDFASIPEKCLDGVDAIYHLAARLPVEKCSFKEYYLNNVVKTRALLGKCRRARVKRLIYVSSSAVYGRPRSPITELSERAPIEPYGKSKLLAEELCELYRNRYSMNISIVRPRTVVGANRLGILHLLFTWIRNNRNVYLLGNGRNKYQLLSLDDLVGALVLLLDKGSYEDYNLGAECYQTLYEDVYSLIKLAGSSSKIVLFPSFLKELLPLIEKFIPLAKWHYKLIDKDFYFDITKAKRELGWKPRESNIQMLVKAYRTFKKETRGMSAHLSPIKLGILKLLP